MGASAGTPVCDKPYIVADRVWDDGLASPSGDEYCAPRYRLGPVMGWHPATIAHVMVT